MKKLKTILSVIVSVLIVSSITYAITISPEELQQLTNENLGAGIIQVFQGGTGSTTMSGILKGNGTGAVQTSIPDTDYQVPLTFGDGLTRTTNDIDCDTASGSAFGCLTSANWTTFNNKWDLASTTIAVPYGGTGSTTLTGMLKGNGTNMVATAIPGTDYQPAGDYITLTSLSSTATGLTYTNTTGVFSLTSGYTIPTNTQISSWNNKWDLASTTIAVPYGGTGLTTITDGGIMLGSGTGAVTPMGVLGDGVIVIGDNATDPTTLAAFTSSTGQLKHEYGGIEADISAITTGGLLRGASAGAISVLALGTAGQLLGSTGGNLGYIATSSMSIGGLAGTATALAADPTDCGANTWATTIAANGNLTCGAVTYAGISAMTSSNFAGLISDETGSAGNVVLSVSPTFTGLVTMANATSTLISSTYASSTEAYFGNAYIPSLGTITGSFLAVDTTGKIIATSTPSGGAGTVTSVGMSIPTGFAIGGSPVTTSGTLALTFAAGYSLPTDASQSSWNNKWDLASSTIGVAYGGTGSTTLTGILKGNATGAIQTAVPGTDYQLPGDYITLTSLSSTATGLTYTNTTGVFSLADGYVIPQQTTLDTYLLRSNSDWIQQSNFGVANLTASTTIPVWFKDAIYASSTLSIRPSGGWNNPLTIASSTGSNMLQIDWMGKFNLGASTSPSYFTVHQGVSSFVGLGTISATWGNPVVTGVGTKFLTEVGIGDRIKVGPSGYITTVVSVQSDTSLKVDSVTYNATNYDYTIYPSIMRIQNNNSGVVLAVNDTGKIGIGTIVPTLFPGSQTSFGYGMYIATTTYFTFQNIIGDYYNTPAAGELTAVSYDYGGDSVINIEQQSGSSISEAKLNFLFSAGADQVLVANNRELGEISFQGSDGDQYLQASAISGIVNGTPADNVMYGALTFNTNNGTAATVSERMRITAGGNVGIGTSTPAGILNVASTLPKLYISDTDATTNNKHWFLENNAGTLTLGTTTDSLVVTNTRAMTILNNGNVGIGTTTPKSKLEINGDVSFSTSTQGVVLMSPNGTEYRLYVTDDGTLMVEAGGTLAGIDSVDKYCESKNSILEFIKKFFNK